MSPDDLGPGAPPATPLPNAGALEHILGQQADAAIRAGADPASVTDRLGQMVRVARLSPALTAHANDALAQGADPAAVAGRLWTITQSGHTETSTLQGESRTGNLARRIATENQQDADLANVRSLPEAAGEALAATGANLARGIPGMEAVEAGARAWARTGLSKLGIGQGESYTDALNDIRGATGKIPTALRVSEQIAGSIPTAAVLPGGPVAGGAAYGAANEILNASPESVGERLGRTAAGAGLGAAGGLVMKGAGALAQKTGLTDAIGKVLRARMAPAAVNDVGQAVGTTGAANKLVGARQAVLDAIPESEQSAAGKMLQTITANKAKATELYNAARAVPAEDIQTPEIQRLVRDVRLQPFFQEARAASYGGALGPTAGAPVDLPSPEEVHLVKQTLRGIASGRVQYPGVSGQEARNLSGKVSELTDALHDASDEWAQADAFYAQAKNGERAFQKAYSVPVTPGEQALNPDKLKTPEALQAWAQRAAGTPVGTARAEGVRLGAAGRLAQAVRGTPLTQLADKGFGGVLDASNEAAGKVRSLAFQRPDDAEALQAALTAARPARPVTSGVHPYAEGGGGPVRLFGRLRAAGNPLQTAQGRALLDQIGTKLNTDAGRRQAIANAIAAKRGRGVLDLLTRGAVAGLGAGATSPEREP